MTDTEHSKSKRTTAKQQFTRKLKVFETLLDQDDVDKQEASQVFDEVSGAWCRVEDRHEDYVESLKDTEVAYLANEAWINAEELRYNTARKQYYKFKSERERSERLAECTRILSSKDADFEILCRFIENLIDQKSSKESLTRERGSLRVKYDDMCSA